MFVFIENGNDVEIQSEFTHIEPTQPVEYEFTSHPQLSFEAEDLSPVYLFGLENGLYRLRIHIYSGEDHYIDDGKFAVINNIPNTPRNEHLKIALTENIDLISLEAAQDAYSLIEQE